MLLWLLCLFITFNLKIVSTLTHKIYAAVKTCEDLNVKIRNTVLVQMDFQSLVTRENFKAILHLHLKRQIHANFSSLVSADVQALSDLGTTSSESIVSSISGNLAQSDTYKEFSNAFLNDLDHLFIDKEKYVPKEEYQGTVSQCSSASSVNASIDYISFDQFQDTIHLLLNGVNAEKLEALETFSRLPSLEHIIKQTLWPSVEKGLHDALLSNVIFLREASLKVFSKMLSSTEPKVVQESYNSLIKHVSRSILPSLNQNDVDFIHKRKSATEIVVILNKFLQNIPNHWLRYPQQVIENITVQSVSIFSHSSQHSKVFPIWLCVALCDKKAKWLSNILHGHLSRSYLINTIQNDSETLKLAIQFCDNFVEGDSCFSCKDHCQNSAKISEITHIICFLAHLLRYSQGRQLFYDIYYDSPYPWLNCFNLLLKCSHKLCSVFCYSCSEDACMVLSELVNCLWQCDKKEQYLNLLVKMLLVYDNFENMSSNNLWFITMCFCNVPSDILLNNCSSEAQNMVLEFISSLFNHLSIIYDEAHPLPETSSLLNAGLSLATIIVSESSGLLLHLVFKRSFCLFITKIAFVLKFTLSSFDSATKTALSQEIERNATQLFMSMLQKPYYLSILIKNQLVENATHIILEKILEDIKSKNCVCQKDISILSNALNCTFSTKSILNQSFIFKLSSVIWQFHASNQRTLPEVRLVLENIVPSILPHIFQSQIFLDENVDTSVKLFLHILMFPSLTNQEFFIQEEYILLALQIFSTLMCSIFAVCYMEANHKLSNLLFELQTNVGETPCIIDAQSVILNHILIKLNTVGGDKEKVLPPETLSSIQDYYNWPFITEFPVSEIFYSYASTEKSASLDETVSLVLDDDNIKDVFLMCLEKDSLSNDVISQLLKASSTSVKTLPSFLQTMECIGLDSIDNLALSNEIIIGLQLTRRYGEILHLLNEDEENTLEKLLIDGKYLLGTVDKKEMDLFVCTIALIFKCNAQNTKSFLEMIVKSPVSLFIWHERMLRAVETNPKFICVLNNILECCDMIVKKTLPQVYSAFQFSKMLPSALFWYFIQHCFWNYLNFEEISHFILSVVLLGEDFAIYFFVSLLKHEENFILKNALSCNIVTLLKKRAISGYKMKNYVSFINKLSDTYKNQMQKYVFDILCEDISA